MVKGYVDKVGKNVHIQRESVIVRRVSIGDYSGIGSRCSLQGNVSIGNHVMMGPEVLIYTQNHLFERTDIPMDS